MDMGDLVAAVEAAFARTSAGLERWDDPHPPPDRIVAEEEYSRVTNPARWRIIGARADAWIDTLVELGLATVERDAETMWVEPPTTAVTRTDVLTPTAAGSIPLVVARSRIDGVPDAGLTLGAGVPAVPFAFVPDCGCDACDSGSQDVIDVVDSEIRPVVSGEFRHLRRGRASITVREDGGLEGRNVGLADGADEVPPGFRFRPTSLPSRRIIGRAPWDASGPRVRSRDRMTAILADPTGWDEVSGPSWISGSHGDMRH